MRDNLLINKNPIKVLDSPQPQKMWFQHAGDMLTEIYRSLGKGKRKAYRQGDEERLSQVQKINEFSTLDNAAFIGEVAHFIGTEIGLGVMKEESQFSHDLQNDIDLVNTVIYNILLRLEEQGEIVVYPIRIVYQHMDKFTIKEISLDYKKEFSLMTILPITMHNPLITDKLKLYLDGHFGELDKSIENKAAAKLYEKYKTEAYDMAQIAAFLWVCISEFLQLQKEYLKIKGWLETTFKNFIQNMESPVELKENDEVKAKLSMKENNVVVFTLKNREFELTYDEYTVNNIDNLIDDIFKRHHKISKEDTPFSLAESAPPLVETSSTQSAETSSTQSAGMLSTPSEKKSSAKMSIETPSPLLKSPTGRIPQALTPKGSPLNLGLESMSL